MLFCFADYTLDAARRELRRSGEPITLEPQVFDLLVHLIRNRDRVITKEDLLRSVWGGRIVSESTLTSRINAARKAVGDSGEAQTLIRTSHRKGIRFVGEVTDEPAAEPARPGILSDRPSIAVLPFDNLSDDRRQECFADGMVEEIITGLSRIKWLFVISRNSSFIYKGRPIDVKSVGRDLGVRYVLEGSVRRSGDHVRVTGQLIETATAIPVWADRYDGTLGDIFTLQDEMTMNVIGAIEPTLRKAEVERARRKRPNNLDAYDLFLRALPFAEAAMPERADKALQLLEAAIRLRLTMPSSMALSPGAMSSVTCAADCTPKRGSPLAHTPMRRSPPAVTMRRHWRWAGLSSPSWNGIILSRSMRSTARWHSVHRRRWRSDSAPSCVPGWATAQPRSRMPGSAFASARTTR
jgi:TolB-like protein